MQQKFFLITTLYTVSEQKSGLHTFLRQSQSYHKTFYGRKLIPNNSYINFINFSYKE